MIAEKHIFVAADFEVFKLAVQKLGGDWRKCRFGTKTQSFIGLCGPKVTVYLCHGWERHPEAWREVESLRAQGATIQQVYT